MSLLREPQDTVTARQSADFVAVSRQAADTVGKYVEAAAVVNGGRLDAGPAARRDP